MRPSALVLILLGLALGGAGCAGTGMISPNDPQYARSGAPRAGEPTPSPGNAYGRIMGPDGNAGK